VSDLRAPFPWFGGKRKVAGEVWAALGDVDNYVEPFAGSLAVLLGRPSHHTGRAETVNDADRFVANFWRALAADPEGVARHADWPVNEADLEARHLWLVTSGADRVASMGADPEWFDVRVAGWWVWGICSWIGGGWCSGVGPWVKGDDGAVVNRSVVGDDRPGVSHKRTHLGNTGQGINRSDGDTLGNLADLAGRLRKVRVCCGDWSRVVTDGATNYGTTVGVFLDPPYLGDVRDGDLYATDDHTIAHDVREWALAHGDDPRYRIVLAGYDIEHDHLMPETWRRIRWTAGPSYSTRSSAARQDGNHANRSREVLWCSPHCLNPESITDLFPSD